MHTVTEFTLFSPSFETTKMIIDKQYNKLGRDFFLYHGISNTICHIQICTVVILQKSPVKGPFYGIALNGILGTRN